MSPKTAPSRSAADIFDFAALRTKLGLNQQEMADMLGISARTYFSLETEPAKAAAIYISAAELLSIEEAILRNDASIASPRVAKVAVEFGQLARGRRRSKWI